MKHNLKNQNYERHGSASWRSLTRIKLKASTCVFLPTGKYIIPNISHYPLSLSGKRILSCIRQEGNMWRPRKKAPSFQRKSDKKRTHYNTNTEEFSSLSYPHEPEEYFATLSRKIMLVVRERDDDTYLFRLRGLYHWVRKLPASRPSPTAQGCVGAWGPRLGRTKYSRRSSMTAVSRGGDAGARSHAESLSGVSGHTSRSLSSLREKIVSWHLFVQKTHVVNETAFYRRIRLWNRNNVVITTRPNLW